ncbi:hypothetical protein [Nocardia callitridis]|uniref:hypothetical protein n=1 Tax=Nocardia callitridis TaxID=648753 RepID=UPI0031ECBBB5
MGSVSALSGVLGGMGWSTTRSTSAYTETVETAVIRESLRRLRSDLAFHPRGRLDITASTCVYAPKRCRGG